MKILSIVEALSGAYFPIPVQNEEESNLIDALTKFLMIYGRVKVIVADNGMTFKGAKLKDFCKELGISLKYTNIYSPSANKAERPHSTLNRALELAKESKEAKSGTVFGHKDLLKFSWTQNSIPITRTKSSPFQIMKGGYPFGLYDGTDELPEELKPNYNNNEFAEQAVSLGLGKAFEKFQTLKKPEALKEGQRVKWTKKQNATRLQRLATVLHDNISSVLVQFDNIKNPEWVRKTDLTKLMEENDDEI